MRHARTVVLVHGLWMNGLVMRVMQHRFARWGFAARAFSYPSVRCDLSENGERLAGFIEALGCDEVHLVAHSLGGLVAYSAASRMRTGCGRIVLIGTPFADSFSGRRLERLPAGRRLLGRCMAQWLHEPRPQTGVALDIGVIAGNGGIGMGRLIAPGLPGPHDGVIAVEETAVPDMRDHIVLPYSHTAMLLAPAVAQQAHAYIERGRFERPTT